jgi:pimeloyl-ACP methyl ester carboxylesterase
MRDGVLFHGNEHIMVRTISSAALVLFLILSPGGVLQPQVSPEGHTAALHGIEMYYEVRGEGDPLLLVHGWSGNADYFSPLVEVLSDHYRLIIPELRGHGRSTNPDGTFTIRQAAGDLVALLDHLELESVRAIGASAGGLTLLHMAIQRPSALSRMILVGVGPRFPPDCRQSMADASPDRYSPEWWEVMRERHPRGDEQIRDIVGYLNGLAAEEGDVDFSRATLSEIQAPTLIVQGDSDWCFPPILAAEMHQGITDASLWVIPWGEHVPILGSRAPMFLDVALAFLEVEETPPGEG